MVKTPTVKVPKISKTAINKALRDASLVSLERQRRRTMAGYDVNLRRFKAYAKSTSKIKRANGVTGTGKNRVNLMDTGKLIRGIRRKIGNGYFMIIVSDHVNIGYYHQVGSGGLPKREWFGLDKTGMKDLDKIFKKALNKEMKI